MFNSCNNLAIVLGGTFWQLKYLLNFMPMPVCLCRSILETWNHTSYKNSFIYDIYRWERAFLSEIKVKLMLSIHDTSLP